MAIVRRSERRDEILRLMQSTDCHPSAEWVYQQMKDRFPKLSLGTVYRNLNQLAEEGYIFRLGRVKDQDRYDAQLTPHAHFICSGCGKVIDLPHKPASPDYVDQLVQHYAFAVARQEFILRGLCKDCQNK